MRTGVIVGRCINLALSLSAVLVASLASRGAAAQDAKKSGKDFALVVSGGISLGAYQAGATYALMRHRQIQGEQKLTIATGASAGNINVVLATMFWLAEPDAPGGQRLRPPETATKNVFFDSWVNVGWPGLVPIVNRWDWYQKVFDHPAGSSTFPQTIAPPGLPDAQVYTREDGLVTRGGLAGSLANAKSLLRAEYPGSERSVALGITLTREATGSMVIGFDDQPVEPDACGDRKVASKAVRVPTQRFVVPFYIHAPKKDGPLVVSSPDAAWETKHKSLGQTRRLSNGLLSVDAMLDAVLAAKGFPVAFGPKIIDSPSDPDAKDCRYWDGGMFDNVPVGLALEINDELHERTEKECGVPVRAPLEIIYVDSDTRRSQPPAIGSRGARGLSIVTDLAGRFLDEGRKYELQALSRFDPDFHVREKAVNGGRIDLDMPNRFFPLTADFLHAFGAFLHRDFRRYDYFVGFYDGVTDVARRLAKINGTDALTVAQWRGFLEHFQTITNELTCPDGSAGDACRSLDSPDGPILRAMLWRLLEEELIETAPQDVLDGFRTSHADSLRPAAFIDNDNAYKVFVVLRDRQRRRRELAAQGDSQGLASFDDGLGTFLRQLPPELQRITQTPPFHQEALAEEGVEGAAAENVDRLIRRAIDIERADQKALAGGKDKQDSQRAEAMFQFGRLGAASLLERSREVLDLDPGSTHRIGGGSLAEVFWHLVPQYAAKQGAGCWMELGYEPKLRNPWGWTKQGREWPAGIFVGANLAAQFNPFCPGPEHGATRRRVGAGLGYDPAGRMIDDIQLSIFATNPWSWQPDAAVNQVGFELGLTVLTKIRLALGWANAWQRTADGKLDFAEPNVSPWYTDLDRVYLSLGFTDLNGMLYWGLRSLTSSCEAGCDDPTVKP